MENREILLEQALDWLKDNVTDLSQLPQPLRSKIRSLQDRPWCFTWELREAEEKLMRFAEARGDKSDKSI